jgi:hypothetical protein
LRRRSLRERDGLSERTIPGHTELPSQTSKRPRTEGTRPNGQPRLGRLPEDRKHGDSTHSLDVGSITPRLICSARGQLAGSA